MKKSFYLLLLLHATLLTAQKVLKKSFIDPGISFIRVDANNCFKVELETGNTNEMLIAANIDGEYSKELLLNVKRDGATTSVSADFQPNFVRPNDKLSAHKVISIALKITVPKQKEVYLHGTSCNVFASGQYQFLRVTLNDGKCTLSNISESANIMTQSGDIMVSSTNATILASSKYGLVDSVSIPKGDTSLVLRTTTGNIHLKKTE
ncbi:hypothetical protein [uncultured Kriegella sp.]|uniref:hypothetical protein n=1 Tax=uncultured Kriegella sp. TaxID=1798910 RepID=UPI0030D9CED1|tara:strand:- start:253963 stop:254583 length:621 start_codon:yes stop_codon:yes gene_type:complete